MNSLLTATAVALLSAPIALAAPVLQFDVNGFSTQAVNAAGANSSFGGLTHTGAVKFSVGIGTLNGIFIQSTSGGSFANANLSPAFTLTAFSGQVDMVNGQVTGGSLLIKINNNDQYSCNITPGSGFVTTYVGGGFKIEALTRQGFFNDSVYGDVNVSPWFTAQGLAGLGGSFLEFNYNPNVKGTATSDMDAFVDVVPLPPAGWMGLAGIGAVLIRRRYSRA